MWWKVAVVSAVPVHEPPVLGREAAVYAVQGGYRTENAPFRHCLLFTGWL